MCNLFVFYFISIVNRLMNRFQGLALENMLWPQQQGKTIKQGMLTKMDSTKLKTVD